MLDQFINMKKCGLPLAEIADELGCDYQAVKNKSAELTKKGVVPGYKKGFAKGSKIMENDVKVENNTAVGETAESVSKTTDSVIETADSVIETTESVSETTDSVSETTDSVNETTESVSENADSVIETTDSVIETTDSVGETTDEVECRHESCGHGRCAGNCIEPAGHAETINENRRELVEMINKGLSAVDSTGISVISFKVFIHQMDADAESFLNYKKHLMIGGVDRDGYAIDIEIRK